ncbi:DUF2945 domain-containing protein [Agrococcus terreus]|uniref:DUF2945 domain-containing protein n=1 Tax=Agrococcus terreus TaxID=574649 RepID=UPI00384AA7D8
MCSVACADARDPAVRRPAPRAHRPAGRPHQFDKQQFRASEDEPYYIVESAKTGAKAAHKESALRKR